MTKNTALLALLGLTFFQCSTDTDWQSQNQELIEKYNLQTTSVNLPENGIPLLTEPGQVLTKNQQQSFELAEGINATLFYGNGAMTARLNLEPGSGINGDTLPADRFLFVLAGSVTMQINDQNEELAAKAREEQDGTHGGMPVTPFVYQKKGSLNQFTAGENGAKLLEIYAPVRADYLAKSGVTDVPQEVRAENTVEPSVQPNFVYDLYDIPLSVISETINARIISGETIQVGFTQIDPLSEIPPIADPVEKLELALRGNASLMTLGKNRKLEKEDVLYLPPNMVHGVTTDSFGLDVLEVIWPAQEGIQSRIADAQKAFHEIIPEDAEAELLIDGSKTKPTLIFTEGPKWMNGKVYFSNMFFDQNFGASPQKSSTIEMDPDGHYHAITQGKMQTNGLYPYKNGNLIVCDMMGHRVVEMSTTGKVIQVLANEYNGKPIDGPNDVITDKKGGFYFTDPQFTMEPEKFQPGRAVYYVNADREVIRITEPNEFAMPNGILLSPDGKTLYINNCYDDESWFPVNSEKENYVWAYDVNEDGTIRNGRQFAKLLLPENVLNRKGKSSSADGMAIDTEGNIYVATYMGVQIFNNQGVFMGIINLPTFPVSLCFGEENMKTLFITSFDKIYKIRTKKAGYINYL
ncbi:SMP-30/gluconolactonase/LRE family protein [Jiulongibacter sediminis]|uniref:Gluconolaconase n=1 Tax=Jiulongibacter sediminis TaxID=1605367 RepID=A0A0P7BI58_9BACT|nr:SMP-30/gluconolactonase/LRE family protein [Jiulongibacter sediminis]KPM46761.1 gluconolaconase [Jiulongibacter sediminis]TBX21665.1 gluconolaconase [Jiulongibacter sediminis]